MAIAALLLMIQPERRERTLACVSAFPGVVETKTAADGRLACVFERGSLELQKGLEDLNGLEGVIQMDVVYINYEDDLDETGHMACPPDGGRGRHGRRGDAE
ncbi:MAG: hypothetical protein Q4F72_02730 [Desulfovibrionaceae bacterium]|nr:hypothetical protein [Desulfovibrionaceae bacterium]